MPVLDPRAGAQGEDLGTVQTATMFEVDVFQRCRRIAQLGRSQAPSELAVLPGRPFLVHQQAQTFLEAQICVLIRVALLLEGLDHSR